jgi:Protein of unknown function (DUF3040)
MGTRDDASLSAQERAALAHLEAAAAADDPQLAAWLRGPGRLHLLSLLPKPPGWMRNRWLGGPIAVLGLALIILSISAGWVIGILGAAVATIGLWLLVEAVRLRWISSTKSSPDDLT